MKRVLLVDDNVSDLKLAKAALVNDYQVIATSAGTNALKYLEENPVDLVLLDIAMPGMDGFAFLEKLKLLCYFDDLTVIFLTSINDPKIETKALNSGVVDFIVKPFAPISMLARVKLHLEVREYRRNLVQLINEKTRVIEELQDSMAISFAQLIGSRDGRTGQDIRRIREYLRILSVEMLSEKVYPTEMTPRLLEEMLRSAVLHDIGKVGVEDRISAKNAKLTPEEFNVMKLHVEIGGAALQNAIDQSGAASYLYTARDMVVYHHEKWDGSGYLVGLSETDIPLSARIMAVVDVYNALTSKRPYKEAYPHEKSATIILDESGKAFDPQIIKIFDMCQSKFAQTLTANYDY